MKLSAFAPVLLAATGLAFAQAPAVPEGDKPGKNITSKYKVEIVSTDVSGKSITVVKAMAPPAESKPTTGGVVPSGDTRAPVTLKVDESAAGSLSGLRAGEVVVITCKTSIGPESAMAPGASGSKDPMGKDASSTRGLQHCDSVVSISKS